MRYNSLYALVAPQGPPAIHIPEGRLQPSRVEDRLDVEALKAWTRANERARAAYRARMLYLEDIFLYRQKSEEKPNDHPPN